jgi:hypothetical protein
MISYAMAAAALLGAAGAVDLRADDEVHNLALDRAAYASSSSDFINTGHMATDGEMSTRWQSKSGRPQWIYVDLGAECSVTKVVLRWEAAFAREYKIQVSRDGGPSPATGLVEHWRNAFTTADGKGGIEEIPLSPVKARYVRLWCGASRAGGLAAAQGVALAELEIYGRGGPAVKPRPHPIAPADGTWDLCGDWKLRSQAFTGGDAAQIATAGYDDRRWIAATVPGTVLTSYLDAGAIPDPFYGDQQLQVSDWFCRSKWWYRTEIELPQDCRGKRVWLNFDGVHHRADIWLNGTPLGKISGCFIRGRFDVTGKLVAGRKNCIAVLIYPVPVPLSPITKRLDALVFPEAFNVNTPSFQESAGWDWLSTIRDRNIGIWNRVFLDTSGDVTLADLVVITDLPLLPDTSRADLTVKVELQNHSDRPFGGILRGTLGEIGFEQHVALGPRETAAVALDKATQPILSLRNPRLWWPNGYGPQPLYDFSLRFVGDDGTVSDVKTAKIGIRKFTYGKGRPLTIFCNGKKIMLKGANWGMDEGMLRCDRQGYDVRLRMEKDMHFTILRNCLGNVAKQDFFDLCDRYGLMVWEEFGVNHDTVPFDVNAWFQSAQDRVLTLRNHACVALWCRANEGGPKPAKDRVTCELPGLIERLDGTRLYLRHSTQSPPTDGDGPYDTHEPRFYLGEQAHGFRTEIGSPTIPPIESMRRMMPTEKLWPINPAWATHDWVNGGAMNLCKPTEKAIAAYGPPTGIEDFCRKAQMVNMETFKAIYEGWNNKLWNDCTGVMIWMSNPCWPSLTWNTYDYYLEPTAAYFACKKACEPIHVQWAAGSGEVKVVNNTFADLRGLAVEARVLNMDGSVQRRKSATLDCPANSVRPALDLFAAAGPRATASSSHAGYPPAEAFDDDLETRWSSLYSDHQWLCVDLGTPRTIDRVVLRWQKAYGKDYKIQVSGDGRQWTDVYAAAGKTGGSDDIAFPAVKTRYVRLLGLKRGTRWGYSLWEFEVHEQGKGKINRSPLAGASNVHFIKLELRDRSGHLLSDNFYWRGKSSGNYEDLAKMEPATVTGTAQTRLAPHACTMSVTLRNSGKAVALMTRLKLLDTKSGFLVAPIMYSDNYFSLLPGETKNVTIEYAPESVPVGAARLMVEGWNVAPHNL